MLVGPGQQNGLKLSLKGSWNVRVEGRISTSHSANFTALHSPENIFAAALIQARLKAY